MKRVRGSPNQGWSDVTACAFRGREGFDLACSSARPWLYGIASNQARATVFGALSKMPTVTIVPDLTDSVGRHGVGASIRFDTPGGWERGELIFEPGTYRFLGHQSHVGRREGGQAKETRSSGTAVMSVQVVDSMPAVPKDAGKPMFC